MQAGLDLWSEAPAQSNLAMLRVLVQRHGCPNRSIRGMQSECAGRASAVSVPFSTSSLSQWLLLLTDLLFYGRMREDVRSIPTSRSGQHLRAPGSGNTPELIRSAWAVSPV